MTTDTQSLLSAINLLRESVSRRFGPAKTSLGECSIEINDDHVELTNENGTVIAWSAAEVAEELK